MYASMHGFTCFVIPVATILLSGVRAWITKCTDQRQNKVILNCPDGHVIYRPLITMGTSRTGTCNFQDGDCTGLPEELKETRDSCYWKNSCKLSWNNSQTLTSPSNSTCYRSKPTYIQYNNPTCIQENNIIDISSNDDRLSTLSSGVIRSSRHYPHKYDDVKRPYRKVLPARPGYVIVLTVDDLSTSGSLMIQAESERGDTKRLLYERETRSEETFQIEEENVIIFFNVSRPNTGRGFVLRFEYRQNGLTNNNKIKTTVMADAPNPKSSPYFNVKGSLDTCIGRRDAMNLICPEHHVIFKPDVTTGVSNGGTCMSKPGDCQGLTHTLITQINRCYWKSQCGLSWTKGVPLTMTNTLNCLAQYPSYISVKRYECLHESSVFDICDNSYTYINTSEGIIRSHKNYPWHYPTRKTTCRKYISVNKDQGLRIYTDKMDLDPDTKGDNLKFYSDHQTQPLMKRIGGQHADIILKGGCLMIEFKVSKRSKGGGGFILKFEPARNNDLHFKKSTDGSCEQMFKPRKVSSKEFQADTNGKKKKRRCRGKGDCQTKRRGKVGLKKVSRKGKGKKTPIVGTLSDEVGKPVKKDDQITIGLRRKANQRRKNRRGRKRGKGRKRVRGKKGRKGRRKWKKIGRKDRRERKNKTRRSYRQLDLTQT